MVGTWFGSKFDNSHYSRVYKKRERINVQHANCQSSMLNMATISISKSLFNPLHAVFWDSSFHLSHFHLLVFDTSFSNESILLLTFQRKSEMNKKKVTFKLTLSFFWFNECVCVSFLFDSLPESKKKKRIRTRIHVAKKMWTRLRILAEENTKWN